jgi:hypothetical protein
VVDLAPPGPVRQIANTANKATQLLAALAPLLQTESTSNMDGNGDGKPDAVGDVRQLLAPLQYVQFANAVIGVFDSIFPTETVDQFKELRELLNQQTAGLGWQIQQTALDQDLALATSAVIQSKLAIETQMQITADGDPMNNSSAAVERAMLSSAFERAYAAAPDYIRAAVGEPDHPNGQQYDWRLGVPVLMKLITMRLIVASAFDPVWMKNGLFRDEILRFRASLLSHYQKMVSGVRCGEEPPHGGSNFGEFVCVDVHSGMKAYAGWPGIADPPRNGPDNNLTRMEVAKLAVLRQMPLFEMRSMIDALYTLANGNAIFPTWGGNFASMCKNLSEHFTDPATIDLYQTHYCNRIAEVGQGVDAGPIYAFDGSTYCLDVKWNGSEEGTPLWVYECANPYYDVNPAQLFSYSRDSSELKHVASGLCVDVQNGSIERGAPAQLWSCNGSDAQRWTFDPENGVLQNALNTVLDVQWGNAANETPVWTWYRTEGDAQRWH